MDFENLNHYSINPATSTLENNVIKPPPSYSSSSSPESSLSGSRKRRKTQYIINVPVEQLKKITKTDGINSLTKETQQFVGITTIHGPLRIYRGHGLYRFLWLLATILCTAFCIWQINLLIKNYVQKPTASQISFKTPSTGMELPIVTVCSCNNMMKSFIDDLNKTSNGTMYPELLVYLAASGLEPNSIMTMANGSDSLYEIGEELLHNFTSTLKTSFSIKQFFTDAGPKCEDTLKVCTFAGSIFDCCSNAEVVLTELGKCFKIDLSKVPLLQKFSGMNNGLQIYADYNIEERIDLLNSTRYSLVKLLKGFFTIKKTLSVEAYGILAQTIDDGFRIYLHSKNEHALTSKEGISVSPGNRIYTSISATKYLLLSEQSWGRCIDKWPEELGDNGLYSVSKCTALCKAKFYHEHCGCSPFVYNIDEKYDICTAYDIYNCTLTIKNESDGLISNPEPDCTFCKTECDRWDYHTFNSYGDGIQQRTANWVAEVVTNETIDRIKENYVSINIFYREMAYTQYEEIQSTTFTQTVSNIGGTMGMCLGISFLSMIEIIVYLWKATWILISKKRRDYLVRKRLDEEEREKTLKLTLQNISSQKTINYEEPLSFKRMARSIRRKVSIAFPRKNSIEQTIVDDKFVDERLYGAGKTNFDKDSDFVKVTLNQTQMEQLLKNGAVKTDIEKRPRSQSCPQDNTSDWKGQIATLSQLAALNSNVVLNQKVYEKDATNGGVSSLNANIDG